jgi:hypothetical protein
MTPFLDRVLRIRKILATVFRRLWERIELPFLSKAEVARRVSTKFETVRRKDLEAERIDRLTNPRNYQGK